MTALAMFNEIIPREAFAAKVPVIDLRLICSESPDYSEIFSIEPSAIGREKIVQAIVQLLINQRRVQRKGFVTGLRGFLMAV